jgi:hypothetical protein
MRWSFPALSNAFFSFPVFVAAALAGLVFGF